MKKLALLLLWSALAYAQGGNMVVRTAAGAPAGSCAFVLFYINSTNGDFYGCKLGAWQLLGPGAAGAGTVTNVSFTGGLISVADPTGAAAMTVAGTSGGVVYFSGANTWASSGALTANLPVIGGGAGGAPSVGTRSGNTTAFVTTTGAQTSGDCVSIDANGNHIASGAACGGGSGANTALSNLAAVAINTALLPDAAAADDFGSATLPFKDLYFAGSSGTPGTNNFQLTGASTGGTRTVTAADGNSVTVIGDSGAANNFLTAISPTTGVISKAQPAFSNLSGALGATQLTGTSGGIPYFSAANTYGSSAALTANAVVIGGGAGATPATISASTTTTHALFATATAPAFRAVATGDLPSNTTIGAFGCTIPSPVVGSVCYGIVPYACTIAAWDIMATGTSPTTTIDIWKLATGGTALPTVAATIMGTKPALAAGNAVHSSTLTGWTTSVAANDRIAFNVDAVSAATSIIITIQCNRT